MKFGHLYEFHKIPEWYTEYVDYIALRARIDVFKRLVKADAVRKLKGYYMINNAGQIYCIDFIKNYKEHLDEAKEAAFFGKKRDHSVP